MKNQKSSTINILSIDDLKSAAGPVTVRMTNDYLFRALLQRNNNVLKSLIRSLLHLAPEDIISAEITNSIELGAAINEKEFILDIKVHINSSVTINLEMQVINEHNWVDRSTSYLCRTYSNLNHGDDYTSTKAVIQIGLLDFTLFPERPEFYATYKLINEKNFSVYSDKLRLSVVDLTRIDLATEEDRHYSIDTWASFFKAQKWEDLKMIAHNNSDIQEAVATVYQLTQEEKIRQQCEAREDYYRRQNDVQRRQQRLENTNRQLTEQNKQLTEQVQQQSEQIQQQAEQIQQLNVTINALQKQLAELQLQI